MRPTDENQSTSTRPNLMSPRRLSTSGEDSILAMLEREPARKRTGAATSPRLAGYGAAAGLALVLTGALVWLAANNDGMRHDASDTVLAEAAQLRQPAQPAPAAQPGPAAGAALHQVAMATVTDAPELRPASAAVIVDQAPPAETVPPLRLLKPAPGKPGAEKAATTAHVPGSVPARAGGSAPASAAAPSRPPAKAAAKPKPTMLAKSVRPVQPKSGRAANTAKAADGSVDADVALISAVIVHANGHAPEGSQMTELLCPNDSCLAKPARQ